MERTVFARLSTLSLLAAALFSHAAPAQASAYTQVSFATRTVSFETEETVRPSRKRHGGSPQTDWSSAPSTLVQTDEVSTGVSTAEMEKQLLDLVNRERTRHGLRALAYDSSLSQVARAHSQDMVSRNYFSHDTPEGKSVDHRAKDFGLRKLLLGENLALHVGVELAHEALMNSPGHRKNILLKSYSRVGMGIVKMADGQIMVTQVFVI